MRNLEVLLSLAMVVACEVKGPVLLDDVANAGASDGPHVVGILGGTGGTLGAAASTPASSNSETARGGSASVGTSSTPDNDVSAPGSGGSSAATSRTASQGGVTFTGSSSHIGLGGSLPTSGGSPPSGGGSSFATGGTTATNGGSSVTTGGTLPTSGGSTIGSGATTYVTTAGAGGNGSNTTKVPCESYTDQTACEQAGCMAILGRERNATSPVFVQCESKATCTAVMKAASPPGAPDECYVFGGCMPTGWTNLGSSTCPGPSGVIPTITSTSLYLNCMPTAQSDALAGTFDVYYQNTSTNSRIISIESAKVTFNGNPSVTWTFDVTPADSGVVAAHGSSTVTHRKVAASGSGNMPMCACNSGDYVKLSVVFESEGETLDASYADVLIQCVY